MRFGKFAGTATLALVVLGVLCTWLAVLDAGQARSDEQSTKKTKNGEVKTATSPTGRNPIFLWSEAQQDVWTKMKSGHDPWMNWVFEAAGRTGTSQQVYFDLGQWCVLAYQITGEAKYAKAAIDVILPYVQRDPVSTKIDTRYGQGNTNFIRAFGWQYPIWLDWLWPALSDEQKKSYVAGLHKWCDWCLGIGTKPYNGGFRLTDSDQLLGQYFLLALTDLATDSKYLSKAQSLTWAGKYDAKLPIGGLDATAADFATVRNRIKQFVTQYSAGGEWCVSSEYNLGDDVTILLVGSQAVKTASSGKDHFPEVTSYLADLAAQAPYDWTPDLKQRDQWGDDENPRLPKWFWNAAYLAMMSGLVPDDPWLGPTVKEIKAKVPLKDYCGGLANAFYFYDPSKGPAKVTLPTESRYCAGNATMRYMDAKRAFVSQFILPKGSLDVGAAGKPIGLLDHEVCWFRNWRYWANGEQVITHPVTYGTFGYAGQRPDYVNSVMLAGFGTIPGRKIIAHGSGRGYRYITGQMKGSPVEAGGHQPPPEFLHDYTGTVLHLDPDIIVLKDHFKLDDPQKLPGFAGYSKPDQANIKGAYALIQSIQHCPVKPTVDGNTISWTTAGGQTVTFQYLLPKKINLRIDDEHVLWPEKDYTRPPDTEKKWQFRVLSNGTAISGSTAVQDDFLCVVSVGEVPAIKLNANGSLVAGSNVVVFKADGSVEVTGDK